MGTNPDNLPSIKLMEDLLKMEDDSILLTLLDRTKNYLNILKEKDIGENLHSLVLKLAVKALHCTRHKQEALEFLMLFIESDFFGTISTFLNLLPIMNDEYLSEQYVEDVINIIKVSRLIFEKLPSHAVEILSIVANIKDIVNHFLPRQNLSKLLEKFNDLEMIQNLFKETLIKRLEKESSNYQVVDKPPDDYKTLSIMPTAEELLSKEKPFLRPARKGCYSSNEEYLDIQFRLLREDFFAPLRSGIHQFLQRKSPKEISDIRIYNDVKILRKAKHNFDKIILQLQFNQKHFEQIHWETSKRLMFGSFLCLSGDNFQTIIFATVEDRNSKNLKQGVLYVHMFNPDIPNMFEKTFTVVESAAYFGAYQPVLEGLKEFSFHSFPFEQYIIKCDMNGEIDPPSYLKKDDNYIINNCKLPVLDCDQWPSHERFNFDDSQYRALQMALTKKFAVIQGPPGCGKTFVGLKIVETLLTNSCIGPILVVCYTNHALDQFLEGILKFCTDGIVRVGGKSSSTALEQYNLKKLRKNLPYPSEMNEQFETYNALISAKSSEEIISENLFHLSNVLNDDQYYALRKISVKKVDGILIWLCGMEEKVNQNSKEDHYKSNNKIHSNTSSGIVSEPIAKTEACSSDITEQINLIDIESERQHEESVRFVDDSEEYKESSGNLYTKEFSHNDRDKEWILKFDLKKNVEKTLKKLQSCVALHDEDASAVESGNLMELNLEKRLRLYLYWLEKYHTSLKDIISSVEESYNLSSKIMHKRNNMVDSIILKKAQVIGMTTTGAAKFRNILKQVKCQIVIVEEAAEVLEAHVLTSLSEECQHLILIGDHQQLRPNPNSYELGTKFNLNLSLFERMILNGITYTKLNLQYRMRPEIASLMVHFYENLENHESVLNFEKINGVMKNIYFIQHEHLETENSELMSHSNLYEVKFIRALCNYLLQQNYSKEQITILTPYSGQLHLFQKSLPNDIFKGVRVTSVDNFQGEENDIILLSLVRSNETNNIGFLNTPNRVCVALSRAKKGFYCIGNFNMFAEKSELWENIVSSLKNKNCIGSTLPVSCRAHQIIADLASEEDFIGKVPEGGCLEPCIIRLSCGHKCEKHCHHYDTDHEEYKCLKPCTKYCIAGHPCKFKCSMECPKCEVDIIKKIASCGHTQMIPCYEKNNEHFKCIQTCGKFLDCNHPCREICGMSDVIGEHSCSEVCKIKVKNNFKCGHSVTGPCYKMKDQSKCSRPIKRLLNCDHVAFFPCWKDPQDLICLDSCPFLLDCGHPCTGSCSECHRNIVHKACKGKCKKILTCAHICTFKCTEMCPPCKDACGNYCSHGQCFHQCGKLCVPCRKTCSWNCFHFKCSRLCYELCNRPACNEPCQVILFCGHQCIGLCGEICPQLCRFCHSRDVYVDSNARFIILEDCNHVIEVGLLDHLMNQNPMENGSVPIELKLCPTCKTPIRFSYRYGNIIRILLQDIENVKLKINQSYSFVLSDIRQSINNFKQISPKAFIQFSENFQRETKKKFSYFVEQNNMPQLKIIQNQLNFLTVILKLEQKSKVLGKKENIVENLPNFKGSWISFQLKSESKKYVMSILFPCIQNHSLVNHVSSLINEELEWMKRWILSFDLTIGEQSLMEFALNLNRIQLLLTFYDFIITACQFDITPSIELQSSLTQARNYLNGRKSFSDSVQLKVEHIFENLKTLLPISDLTIYEKVKIFKTNLSFRQWYKCHKEHYYSCESDEEARKESACPEC